MCVCVCVCVCVCEVEHIELEIFSFPVAFLDDLLDLLYLALNKTV